MIAHTLSVFQRHARRTVRASMLLVLLALLTFTVLQSSAAAQSQVRTTVMPWKVETNSGSQSPAGTFTTDDTVTLHFRITNFPTGAMVDNATLQLTCSEMLSSADGTVDVYLNNGTQDEKFGAHTFNQETPGKDKPAQWKTTEGSAVLQQLTASNGGGSFVLKLVPQKTNNPTRQWYSTTATASKNRPRLILEYTVPDRAPLVQAEGVPAMHSPKKFLPDPTAGAQYGSVDVISNLWSYEPVFYKGLVYVITNDKQLRALSPLGGQPIWSVPLTDPGQHVLVSESGCLYIVGNQQILVYQLDPLHPFTQAAEVKTADNRPLSTKVQNLNPTLAPAVGADGSLYFVNGQEVYGLNPDLQELWKYTLGDKLTSRVTGGPSGQFVYLLARNEGLSTIHAQTGETFSNALPNQDALKKLDTLTLHAPVVIRHPDGTEKIYVAANSANDGVLAAFNNVKTAPAKGNDGTIVAAEHWPALQGLWSQPIIDQLPSADPVKPDEPNQAKRMYAVQKGTLTAIDWLTGSTTTPAMPIQVGTPNGPNFAMDAAGNVVAADSRLLFGADGTLYTVDPSNQTQRTLRAIVPQYTLSGASATISSPTHLRVDGTVSQTTTLSAAGSVLLGNGFSVQLGATLTVKHLE